ncbi:MAG: acyl carrier protein [Magnetococcales bacterium]|nr:acyl carrier protein [Magnetococcales bacterium]
MSSQILDTMIHEIRKILGDDTMEIVPELVMMDIPNWDSIIHMQVITRAEEIFNIRFSIEALMSMTTIDALVQSIKAMTPGRASV